MEYREYKEFVKIAGKEDNLELYCDTLDSINVNTLSKNPEDSYVGVGIIDYDKIDSKEEYLEVRFQGPCIDDVRLSTEMESGSIGPDPTDPYPVVVEAELEYDQKNLEYKIFLVKDEIPNHTATEITEEQAIEWLEVNRDEFNTIIEKARAMAYDVFKQEMEDVDNYELWEPEYEDDWDEYYED